MKRYNVLGILGTVNPNVPEVPFFSLEEILKEEGVNRLHHLLERNIPYSVHPQGSLDALVDESRIWVDLDLTDKEEIIEVMAKPLQDAGLVTDGYVQAVLERETEGMTILANGIAIPHAYPRTVNKNAFSFARLKKPILWKNGMEVKHIFLLAFKEDAMEWVLSLHELFHNQDFIEVLNAFQEKGAFINSLKK
jgi:mannitol/fructose-specific phosphotransferase system IIA component (Ntr-type)